MKKVVQISIFGFLFLIFSCGQNSHEKKLNGQWFEVEGESRWQFYEDSLDLGYDLDKVKWTASEFQIKFDFKPIFSDSIETIKIDYQLNKNEDSLFGKLQNAYGIHDFSLLKAKDYFEYVRRKYNVQFELPTDNSAKRIAKSFNRLSPDHNYGLKIFLYQINGNIVAKTELSESLEDLKIDIINFKKNAKVYSGTDEEHDIYLDDRFHFRVFADKKIHDSIITNRLKIIVPKKVSELQEAIMIPPNGKLPIRIYRIYKNDKKIISWDLYGKKLQTNAFYLLE